MSRVDPTGHLSWGDVWNVACLGCVSAAEKASEGLQQFVQQVGRSSTYVLNTLSQVNYIGGYLATGYLANPMFGTTYGATTGDWRSVGQATMTAASWAATVYGLQGMYTGWEQTVIKYWGNIPLATAEFGANQYVNARIRQEVADYAEKHGMSASQFNLRLFGFSLLGNITPGIGSRLTDEGWANTEWGIRGFGNRGIAGLPFDVVDTVLAYQGLPTASAAHYMISSARGMPLTGHSLGALDVANLSSFGFVTNGQVFAIPFGKVAAGGVTTVIGDGDIINGFSLGKMFNWNADVQSVPLITGHPCSNYVGCGI